MDALEKGNYREAAAAYGGISYKTFADWMNKGERRTGRYREFRNAVLAAETEAESKIVEQWRAQIPTNWQAARDFLARRFPDRWGNKDRLQVDFVNSPEWTEIRTLIVNVLRPHPEALQALMEHLPAKEDK